MAKDTSPPVEKVLDEDELRLAALGRDQVLKRNFNVWSLIFMAFCTSVTWEALCSTMAQALLTGGSSSMIWGFVAASTGALMIALSLSEFASIIPTSGGQYHYVAALSPPKYRRILCWIAGWTTIWGWILSSVAGIFATSMQINSYAVLFHPDYVYQRWHTSLILIALTTMFLFMSVFGIRWLHRLTFLGITLHLTGYVATIIYLLVKVHPKNSAAFVFSDLTNLSGWKSDGVAWSIGLLSSALGFVGWDSATHMAEEMKHASRDLPLTLWGCVALSGILTWPWVIALMFCMTDITSVVTGPVGSMSPLVQLIYNVSGGDQATTIGMTSFYLILSCLIAGPSCVTATSRIIWSFAREGGLPSILARVDSRREVPVNALIVTWFSVSALALIYIGNSTAFYGLASGVTVVMIFSYALPIVLNLLWGIKRNHLRPGPFTLGRWSRPINIGAVCWAAYIMIFLCFPTAMPVTDSNMNYSCVIFGFGLLAALVSWVAYGRRTYIGVLNEVDGAVQQAAAEVTILAEKE